MKKYIFFQFSGVFFQQIKWNMLWFHCTMKIWPFICGNMKKIRWTRGFFCFIWRICPYVVTSTEIEQGTENVQRQLLHRPALSKISVSNGKLTMRISILKFQISSVYTQCLYMLKQYILKLRIQGLNSEIPNFLGVNCTLREKIKYFELESSICSVKT